MDRFQKEDPKLSEVKAVLRRLQRISAEPSSADSETKSDEPVRPPRRVALAASVSGAVVVLIVAGAFAFLDFSPPMTSTATRPQPPSAALLRNAGPEGKPAVEPHSPTLPGSRTSIMPPTFQQPGQSMVKPALEVALGHLTAGRVLAARTELLALVSEDAADVAWALARSYDPNFLGTIPAADAGPDVGQATRWYRAWYTAAVKQGLVADSVSLERIIGSMR